jgi:hypothetical protein
MAQNTINNDRLPRFISAENPTADTEAIRATRNPDRLRGSA